MPARTYHRLRFKWKTHLLCWVICNCLLDWPWYIFLRIWFCRFSEITEANILPVCVCERERERKSEREKEKDKEKKKNLMTLMTCVFASQPDLSYCILVLTYYNRSSDSAMGVEIDPVTGNFYTCQVSSWWWWLCAACLFLISWHVSFFFYLFTDWHELLYHDQQKYWCADCVCWDL